MRLQFIVDTQLPPSLAEFLRRRSLNATHVIDYPSGALTSDREIIKIAQREDRIIITKDSDFWDYFLVKGYPPSVLLLQVGNLKNSELFSLIDRRLETILSIYTKDIAQLVVVQRNRIVLF